MENWVRFDIERMRRAIEKWPRLQDRGSWVTGYHAGAAGSILWPGANEPTLDGYEAGKEALHEGQEYRKTISEKRSAAGSRGNAVRWGDRKSMAKASQLRSQTGSQNIARDETEQDSYPQGGITAGAPATPPPSKISNSESDPDWAIRRREENACKVEAARRKLKTARTALATAQRFKDAGESRDLVPLEKAVEDIEIDILNLGARP